MIHKKIVILLSAAFVCLLSACNSGVMTSETFMFPEGYWLNETPQTLQFHATDTTQEYSLTLSLVHSTDFPYRNLYVRTKTIFPSGREIVSVSSLELTNEKGRWSGDCGSKKCDLELPLQKKFTFPELGTYTWMIEPYMRVDTIHEVERLKVVCREISK